MMEKQAVTLDAVLQRFGMFDRYHLRLMLMFALAYATNSLYSPNYIFAVEQVQYHCAESGFPAAACVSNTSATCSHWEYDKPHSFVAEFGLACVEWKRTLVGTAHSAGYMLGLLLVGPLSDRVGRKSALVLTGVVGGVMGVARSFATHYWLYVALEVLEAAIGDTCSPVYVLNLEIVSSNRRVTYYGLASLGYALGGMLLPLAAASVPYWRNFLRVIYSPALLFLCYLYLVDESPRWLMSKGKRERAIATLQRAAKINKINLDRDTLEKMPYEKEEKSVKFVELLGMTFRSRALLKRFFICVVWWSTSTFVSYGLMINSVSLQGDKYLNYALVSLIEVPGAFIMMYVLVHFNRRLPLIVTFLAGAALCFAQPFVPKDQRWVSLALYTVSKLMCSLYFGITYLYTSELFPTYTRNSMHALCSALGRVGSILAPQTPLLRAYWSGLPSVVFGCAALVAGAVTCLAPEAGHCGLPDTVRQAEELGIHNRAFTADTPDHTDNNIKTTEKVL